MEVLQKETGETKLRWLKMLMKEAIKRAKEKEEIKRIIERGGFFCSGYVTLESGEKIKKWNLGFYDPSTHKITSVLVTENSVKIGISGTSLRKNIRNPDENKIRVKGEEALEKAKREFERYGKPLSKILISFQKREKEFWNISFITKFGSIINIRIDSTNGDIIKSEEINLFK